MRRDLRRSVLLPLLAAGLLVLSACGGSVSVGKPSSLKGATIAKKANAQLEKENAQIAHGTLTCKDVKYEKGATTRCLRTVELSQGRQVKIGATVTITSTANGGRYTIEVDKQAQEFGELGPEIEKDLAAQYAKQFRTGTPDVTCPAYLKGEVGASITCQLKADSGSIDIVVTGNKVDAANFDTIYTFKQKQ
jgi:hypothetical protein